MSKYLQSEESNEGLLHGHFTLLPPPSPADILSIQNYHQNSCVIELYNVRDCYLLSKLANKQEEEEEEEYNRYAFSSMIVYLLLIWVSSYRVLLGPANEIQTCFVSSKE